ncbi:MAG: GAF domain-containing protein [Anaerolineaceae bacterium]|nr:GAF domain-containing protein [Anaerolineaceae bacterium]
MKSSGANRPAGQLSSARSPRGPQNSGSSGEAARVKAIHAAVGFSAEAFLKSNQWNRVIDEVLARLGEAAGAGRVCLLLDPCFSGERLFLRPVYQWEVPGGDGKNADCDCERMRAILNSWNAQLYAGAPVYGSLRQFDGQVREDLLDYGIRSLAILPIMVRKQPWGEIAFLHFSQERMWSGEEIEALSAAASLLGAAAEHEMMSHALERSEGKYHDLIDNLGEVIFTLDRIGRLNYISPSIEKVTGYRPAEMEGYSYDQFVFPADLEKLKDSSTCSAHEQIKSCELRLVSKDAQLRDVHVFFRPMLENGERIGMTGVMADITEQKKVEAELKQRDAILAAISEATGQFLKSSEWGESILPVLSSLGKAVNTSRACFFARQIIHDKIPRKNQFYYWSSAEDQAGAAGPELERNLLQIPNYPDWERSLSANLVIQANVQDCSPAEGAILRQCEIQSLIVVPIFVEGRWWGFISFDECRQLRRWSAAEVEVLKVAASVLGAAIYRMLVEEGIKERYHTERRQRRLTQVLYEAGIKLNASLNYDEIVDQLLEQITRVIPCDSACIMAVEGERIRVVRLHGLDQYPPSLARKAYETSFQTSEARNLRWIIETQLPLVIPDTLSDPNWVWTEAGGTTRSWAGAPIVVQDQVVAILSLDKYEADFYQAEHAEILAAFTGQAALVLQNARLYAETKESLEREQRLNEIAEIISSSMDLNTILQTILRLATTVVGGNASIMLLVSPDGDVLSAPYVFNLPYALDFNTLPRGESISWDVIDGGKPLIVENYAQHPKRRSDLMRMGVKSVVVVPLVVGEERLGSLGVFTFDPERRFSERDLALAESIGRQAGVAIQKARLFQSAHRRAEEAEILRLASSAVASAIELDEVFNLVLEHLQRVVPYDSASIFLVEKEHVRLVAGRGLRTDAVLNQTLPDDDRLFQEIKRLGVPLILKDAQNDSRFHSWGDATHVHGWIGVPMMSRAKLVGFITLDSCCPGSYEQADADLAQVYANEVALAIEKAHLFRRVQQLAITDPLTGLYNRRYFIEAGQREFKRARRHDTDLSLALIDIDFFKNVNDTYGHLAGDHILYELSVLLQHDLRQSDIVARYGGEEFVMLLPETTLAGAEVVAQRLHNVIMRNTFDLGQRSISISISIGIADATGDCQDIQELFKRADQALYGSKQSGRGRITCWIPTNGDGQ